MNSVIEMSEKLRRVLECNKASVALPFFNSFPKNACESTVALHAILVKEQFSDVLVVVVHGYNRETDESHFWLELDGLVFDLTCDQFKNNSPIFGETDHPLIDSFKPVKRSTAADFLADFIEAIGDVKVFVKNKNAVQSWLGLVA